MKYDYAEMKMTIPMDYFLDMFIGHYDAEKLDANYILDEHKWHYFDNQWTYDNYIIEMQDYMYTLKDYYLSIWKLKTIIEEITGDVIANEFMENIVAFIMTLRFFGIEHINFRISEEVDGKWMNKQEVNNGRRKYPVSKKIF